MGLLSWWKGKPTPSPSKPNPNPNPNPNPPPSSSSQIPGLNGAVEVRRKPDEITVFEFGSVSASGERITMAGYCPVSDDLQPCRWEIVPAAGPDAPQFRIVF